MHREDSSRYLLYIEPLREQKENPVDDDITLLVERAFIRAKPGGANYSDLNDNGTFRSHGGWKGCHITDCGQRSDNYDYLLGNGMITNSLCVFYLRYYRNAIPKSEMDKVRKLCNWTRNNLKY